MPQKLSALIREGAKKRPQAFGSTVSILSSPVEEGKYVHESSTCALGAAYEAITGELPDDSFESTVAFILNATDSRGAEIPYPDETAAGSLSKHTDPTVDVVVSLNDYYKWSRERIADYLEQQGQ